MKRIIILAALLLSFINASAQSGKAIYQKYSESEGVCAVYISSAMFRMIGSIPDLKVNKSDVNLNPIIQTLTGLYILNSESESIRTALKTDVERFVASGKYELLMEVKENKKIMRMYTAGTDDIVDSFVMLAVESGEIDFICLDGKMKREDLEKALANKIKK
ncbi:MAG: DUF4252 domain-containing protein [Bacteroidales bacterium]|nr:DUF4252 domain-containing protein [Bacteroidales bacterium]MBQ8461911.1 DUF4252 domain-containing protein [Bacteroidales bacterium]